jgi:polyisoprenoid-binding protein YceI
MSRMGVMRRGTEATTTFDRRDFGVSANPGIIGDQIQIRLEIEMVQQGEQLRSL